MVKPVPGYPDNPLAERVVLLHRQVPQGGGVQLLLIPGKKSRCSELRYTFTGLNLVLLGTWLPKLLQVKRD